MINDSIYVAGIYRLTAVNFWESAKKIDAQIEKDENGFPKNRITAIPYYFLISHSSELLLKTALLKRGFDQQKLKKFDYRHNLKNLLSELKSFDLEISELTEKIIHGLDDQHKQHLLRYDALMADGKSTFMPPSSYIDNFLEELLLLTRISTQGK